MSIGYISQRMGKEFGPDRYGGIEAISSGAVISEMMKAPVVYLRTQISTKIK